MAASRVPMSRRTQGATYRAIEGRDVNALPQLSRLPPRHVEDVKLAASVLPFRTNAYVVEELIDWDRVPDDPMYQLTFPQPGMLDRRDLEALRAQVEAGAPMEARRALARQIQLRMNPHPSGQVDLNVPLPGLGPSSGIQHKYPETVLFFPSQGQTCHAYCTYCFRWAQFVGIDELKFASSEAGALVDYLRQHPAVTDVLLTGGDPLVMKANVLERYVEPLLALPQLVSLRIGTKAPAYWPQRFLDDPDSDALLRLFERVVRAGKHLAIMAHYSHPRELSTPSAEAALRRLISVGATVRCQSPLIRHVNDDAAAWSALWRREVELGAIPYYLFVTRDTGPRQYFEVPLVQAVRLFNDAYRNVSGLARTVRGPSMSATPGKVVIDGVAEIGGHPVFVLRFLQARDPSWVGRPFFAELDESATWFDQLRPYGAEEFFFAAEMRQFIAAKRRKIEEGHAGTLHP